MFIGVVYHITTFSWRSRLSSGVLYNIDISGTIMSCPQATLDTCNTRTSFPYEISWSRDFKNRIQLECFVGIFIKKNTQKLALNFQESRAGD